MDVSVFFISKMHPPIHIVLSQFEKEKSSWLELVRGLYGVNSLTLTNFSSFVSKHTALGLFIYCCRERIDESLLSFIDIYPTTWPCLIMSSSFCLF